MSVDEAVEHARRAFALKHYEKAVEHYASALATMYVSRRSTRLFGAYARAPTDFFFPPSAFWARTNQCGENAPETADLYFFYGKALLENAISQSSVLGKEQ